VVVCPKLPLRTSGYATTPAAFSVRGAAAQKGDRTAVLVALEHVNTVRVSARVSPEVARQERLYWYTRSYGQKQRPRPRGARTASIVG
jgi:hypothetical protein